MEEEMRYVAQYEVPQLSKCKIAKGCFMPNDGLGSIHHAWYGGCGLGMENKCKQVVLVDLGKCLKNRLEKKRDKLLKDLGQIMQVLDKAEGDENWLEKYKTKLDKTK